MAVHDRFYASARRQRDRAGLTARGSHWTYGELARQARAVAHALRASGLQPGDRVAIDLDNEPATVAAIWGTLTAGGAFVCLDPTTPRQRFCELLQDFRPHAMFGRTERLRTLHPGDLPKSVWSDEPGAGSLDALLASAPADIPFEPVAEDSLASLVYTSGSTGRPKGVMMTHGSMGAAMTAITTYLRSQPTDVVLCMLPLSFDYGHYQLLMTGATGGRLVLEPGFGYPGALLKTLRDERVTNLPGVPTLFALMLQLRGFDATHLPHLKVMTNTGAAVPVPHVEALRQRFPATRLYLMYGLTECKRVSYLPPEEADRRPESVGIPMPGCEVDVVNEEGRPLPPNQVGELVVRGPNLMTGYWNRPDATAQMLREGPWTGERCLYTGDRFHRDSDGFLYFHGRRDDVFKCRGEKVAPAEVEEVLRSMHGVLEAAVLGVEHAVLGRAVLAFVVPASGQDLTPAAVRTHCTSNLESYKVPHEVRVVSELPHNARGKIDRQALRESILSSP